MATNSATATATTSSSSSSSFLKTVCLLDWWLLKAETDFHGKKLAIGGFASREHQAIRVFCSAPIIKRHDAVTLETADGITIMIKGFINRSRTHQNGFPYEACNHFLFGFPYYWESYAVECFGKESITGGDPASFYGFDEFTMHSENSASSRALPLCLDKFSPIQIRDLLMSAPAYSESYELTKSVFTDILGKCSGNALENPRGSIPSDIRSSPPTLRTCLPEEAPNRCAKANKQKHGNGNRVLDARNVRCKESEEILSSKERVNFNCDGRNEPENEILFRNSYMDNSKKKSIPSDIRISAPPMVRACLPEETPSRCEKAKSEKKHGNGNGDLDARNTRCEESKDFLLSKQRDNFICDGRNEPENEILLGSSIMKKSEINYKLVQPWSPSNTSKRKNSDESRGECNYFTRLSKWLGSYSNNKKTKLDSSASMNGGYQAIMASCTEEKLSGVNSSSLSNVSLEGTVDESLAKLPNVVHTEISERLENCKYHTVDDPDVQVNFGMRTIKPSKMVKEKPDITREGVTTRNGNRLKKFKMSKEILTSNCIAMNSNSELSPKTEAFEEPGGEKMTRSSANASTPSKEKNENVKEIQSKFVARRSSKRLANLKNKVCRT